MFTPPVHGFAGSSPLTRGKQDAGRPQFRNEGFIPTHAGRTSSFSWLLRRSADHPRSREENFLGLIAILIIVSHPPLTRGKPQFGHDRRGMGRLIPAHAGKTRRCPAGHLPSGAHPRSRGENEAASATGAPLGWLIPAHAGKTSAVGRYPRSRAAHPRSRGENGACAPSVASCSGSSPLTRGKRLACPIRPALVRLIPAHARKTADGERIEIHDGAHPRSRGENRRLADEVEQA